MRQQECSDADRQSPGAVNESQYRAKKGYVPIFACSLLNGLCLGLIVPALPTFVGALSHGHGEQAAWYGAMNAVYGLMQFVFASGLGALSDRIGRRPVLLAAYIGFFCSLVLSVISQHPLVLLLARILAGLASAGLPALVAYMSDNVPPEERVKWHGRMSAALGFGMLAGAAIGGFAAEADIRMPFKLAAFGYLCAVGFVAYAVSQASRPAAQARSVRAAFGGALQMFLRPFQMKQSPSRFIVVFALVSFAEMLIQSTWMLYTVWRFQWTALDNAKAFILMGCIGLVVQSLLLSKLVARLGQDRMLVLAIASGGLAYLTAGIAHQAWVLGVAVLLGVLNMVLGPLLRAIVSDGVASDRQGEAMGLLHAIGGLGLVGMPLIGAAVMGLPSLLSGQPWTAGAVFFIASSMQFAALVLAWSAIKAPAALMPGAAGDQAHPQKG